MKQVIKINHPDELEQALNCGKDIIRFGEEHCFICAKELWTSEVIARTLDTLKRHSLRSEFVFLGSPTSIAEEKYLAACAELLKDFGGFTQPLVSDWGNIKRYSDLQPIGGERLFIYNSLDIVLLKDLGVKEFYLPFDLSLAETEQLLMLAETDELSAAINLLPPILLVSWTNLFPQTHFSCPFHPQTTAKVMDSPIFSIDGNVVRSCHNPQISEDLLGRFGRVLAEEITS